MKCFACALDFFQDVTRPGRPDKKLRIFIRIIWLPIGRNHVIIGPLKLQPLLMVVLLVIQRDHLTLKGVERPARGCFQFFRRTENHG